MNVANMECYVYRNVRAGLHVSMLTPIHCILAPQVSIEMGVSHLTSHAVCMLTLNWPIGAAQDSMRKDT